MKLLYVFPEPLPLDRARGIQTTFTVRALAAQGIDVLLAHVPGDGDPFGACGIDAPHNVEVMPISHRLGWPFHGVHSNHIFASRLRDRIEWDSVGAVFTRHLKVARAISRHLPRMPMIYEAHEVFSDTAAEARRKEIAALEAFVLSESSAIVANSAATAARIRERHAVNVPVHVIPNGVEYPQRLPEKPWDCAREHVIYAGSFFGWKGVDDLVAAARGLHGFHIRLLGGDDASIARLRASAASGGGTLEFMGRVPHAEVANALAAACIAILPNRADTDSTFTSPIKLFEYMAAGCAIVATDIPVLREVLDESDAAWAPPENPAALAQAIRRVASDPGRARELGLRVREKARGFTWDARGAALARIVQPLMKRA